MHEAQAGVPTAAPTKASTPKAPYAPPRLLTYSLLALVASLLVASGWIMEEDYEVSTEVEAPIDEIFGLLTNVSAIAEVHPHLRGITLSLIHI